MHEIKIIKTSSAIRIRTYSWWGNWGTGQDNLKELNSVSGRGAEVNWQKAHQQH